MDYEDIEKDVEYYEEEESYQLKRYEITSYSTQRNIESILKWISTKKMLIPEFQRDYVWTKNTASKLVDSILLNLPIPNIFLYKTIIDGEDKYLVIDGFQRIQTLRYFKSGYWNQESDIKLSKNYNVKDNKTFKINLKSSEWYNKTYDALDEKDKFNFDEYNINITVFEQTNPANKKSMFEVFERINTGSEKLSEQEIRNAIYGGQLLNDLKAKIINSNYEKICREDKSICKRQNDIDLLLRYITYYYVYEHNFSVNGLPFTTSKRILLNDFCDYCSKYNIDYMPYLENIFKAIDCLYEFDTTAFYSKKRNSVAIGTKIHPVFSEALIIALIKNNYKINISKEAFIAKKLELWNSEEFFQLFIQQSTSKDNIIARVNLLIDILNKRD